ncbi:hypothetical protein A2U01_0075033, partial [Trifolium medium]|nr:hypothetical protein [Trifolium medium]
MIAVREKVEKEEPILGYWDLDLVGMQMLHDDNN